MTPALATEEVITPEPKKKKKTNNAYRTHQICWIGGNDERASPTLYCKISAKAFHRFNDNDDLVKIVPDLGCTVLCIPEEMAKKHGLRITPVDPDKPPITTYGGVDPAIVGQTRAFKCVVTGAIKMLHGIAIKGASEQTILLSWQEMVSWGILPIQYPYPSVNSVNRVFSTEETLEDKGEPQDTVNIGVQEAQNMDNIEEDEEYIKVEEDCKNLKEKLIHEFSDVFREELKPGDKVNVPPVQIEVDKEADVTPTNKKCPHDIHIQIIKAAD